MKKFITFIFILFLLYSCEKPPDDPPAPNPGKIYNNGLIICNEGPFQTGAGTISFWRTDGGMENKIFQGKNDGQELGNIVQSAVQIGLNTFIVVNNSNKIRIVEQSSFKLIHTVDDIYLPRYVIQADDAHAYVSCWDNTVKILDFAGFKVSGTIPVATGPERMLKVNEKVWVLNQGGFGIDSVVSVINVATSSVEKTIQVYPKPSGIVSDENGNVWIICSGKGWNGVPATDNTKGRLLCLDPVSYETIRDIEFPDAEKHPEQLLINGDKTILYYNYPDGIYKFNISSSSLENQPLIPHSSMFYGLTYSVAGNVIYCTDAVDFVQDGWVYKYSAETGTALDSAKAGIIPGNMMFVE